MKNHIPFIFAFVFLIVFSISLPIMTQIKINANLPDSSTETIQKARSNEEVSPKERLKIVADSFYDELLEFDELGLFAPFQKDGKFKADLVTLKDEEKINATTELLNLAIKNIKDFKAMHKDSFYYNELTLDDSVNSNLNKLYNNLIVLCEI